VCNFREKYGCSCMIGWGGG